MSPAFAVEKDGVRTGEIALVKPNGKMEFHGENGMETTAPITLSSEAAAINYARNRGWKEIPLAV